MHLVILVLAILGACSTSNPRQPQIYSLHVQSDIQHRYVHTLVTSKIINPVNISKEVTFTVVLPDTAFISRFAIEDEDGVYEAYVKEKEGAKKEYSEAVKLGQTAAHVTLSARDSNRFAVSVNVEAKKKITFKLTYEELLSRKLGVYKHVINLDPGQLVPDLNVQVNIQESSRISYLEVPAFSLANEINEDQNQDNGLNKLAIIQRGNPYSAVVRWEPTSEEQEELAEKGLRGQLVIKYDVDREQHPQQILVNDGYFVHFFAPPDLPPLQKHVTFVLDVSSSMAGRKLDQLKEAMFLILNDLRTSDYFSLVKFSSKVKVWDPAKAFNKLSKNNPEYNPVVPASDKNIERAKLFIEELDANGATNIYKALKTAIQITRHGKKLWKAQSSNAGSRQQHRHPEPMIIFLTDGEPTEGKTDTDKIITATSNRNKKSRASIFCLALGTEADFDFLMKLSLRNSGFARKIYEASDTALQLTDFYYEVASPLLANVTFKYLSQQVESVSLTRKQFYYFYKGSELVVSGHLRPAIPGELLQYEVKGRSPDGLTSFEPDESPIVIQYKPLAGEPSAGLMERLWAYLSIHQLLDHDNKKKGKKSDLTKQALELALKYSFVTPLTSLVVVKPDGTKHQAETVKNSEIDHETEKCWVDTHVYPDLSLLKGTDVEYGESQMETDFQPILPRVSVSRFKEDLWGDETPSISVSGNRYLSRLVDFDEIDWLGAFVAQTKILLPFGANSSVEVLGPHISKTEKLQWGEDCVTPEGEIGHCRHLRVCPLSTFTQNFTAFLQYFCVLEFRYAGSCCPYRLIPQTT